MEMIKSKILHYLNHLQDVDYLAEIVNSVSDTELCNIINELLQSEDDEIIGSTCLFIRDLLVLGSRPHNSEKFVKGYPESSIVENLEQLLFSPNHFTRKQVVYTLGKACSYSSTKVLNQAFNVFRDTDPILLPRLIGEMAWLGAENLWALLDSMMSSFLYMTRWAVVDVLSEFVGDDAQVKDKLFQSKLRYTEQLRQDSNILIQSEAEWEYQLLQFRSSTYNLPRAERKKKRKDLERQYKPAFSYTRISSAFTNHLHTNGLTQYSVAELDAFILDMTQAKHL
ncbi:hypothetical protein CAL7716_104330 (plasmid) [Calothrix sp. PCC 7716]|nr:hypothetical protein CAL7716_104330 [Calothrix sp. PCC 7716]